MLEICTNAVIVQFTVNMQKEKMINFGHFNGMTNFALTEALTFLKLVSGFFVTSAVSNPTFR